MRKHILLKVVISFCLSMTFMAQLVFSQTLSGRVYEGTTGQEPPNSKPLVGVTVRLYGSNDVNTVGTIVISTATTNSEGWYGLEVSGAFDFYNIVEENPSGYNSDGATSVSGEVITDDWIQYGYDDLSQTTTGNKFWDKQAVSPCEADFSASPLSGCAPLTVEFYDQSTNAQSWYWQFPGGNPSTSTAQNPTVRYDTPGSYSVSLRITCTSGVVDSTIKIDYITVDDCPTQCNAAFEADPRDGCAPLTVNFTDLSANAQSWQWTFPGGNPSSSTQQNPVVVYNTAGSYGVQLTITCVTGQVDSVYQADYITVRDCGQIGDWVWNDLDQDGLQDQGEPGLDSVEVSLYDQNGNLIAMTTTTSTGYYMFSNIPSGSYFIHFSLRPGFIFSPLNQGTDDTIDSDAQPGSGDTQVFTLAAGQNNTDADAGMYQEEGEGEVLGHKWHDLNANGIKDPGEPGIPNWQIILDYNQDGVLDPSVDWITTTDANGDYKFTGYFNGDYFIGEIQQTGWQQTYPDTSFTTHVGNVAPFEHWFYLSPNQAISDLDFGNVQGNIDFGDAPDPSYPTLLASNGARHIIKQGYYLGTGVDDEPDGFASPISDGDDQNPPSGPDDEDGVTMSPLIAPGQAVPITIVASDTGVINAWLDFNINGNWSDAGEHFIAAQPVYPGANPFTLNVPAGAVVGLSHARFRVSSVRQLSFDGLAPDGEVEDYAVEIVDGDDGSITIIKDATPKDNTPFLICAHFSSGFFNILCTNLLDPLNNTWTILNPSNVDSITETIVSGWTLTDISVTGDTDNGSTYDLVTGRVDVDYDPGENIVITFKNKKTGEEELYDFGDAPDPSYPTLMASNGARHLVTPNLYLGSGIDSETDGQPASMADGDDKNILFPGMPYPPGDEDGVQIPPIITIGSTVQINVIASAQGAVNAWLDFNGNGSWADAGEHIIAAQPVVSGMNMFTINVPANAVVGQSYARFRLCSERNISFDGQAPDGEVEDYAIAIQERGDGNIKIIKDADPKDNTPFWISVVYGIHGGAAPYRDPMMNSSIITNTPAGTYNMGESVPAGWTLTDIVVIGDADNGSSKDVANGTVDVDLDPGEDITVTFKNRKTGEEEMFDLGDAPDRTNHSGLNMDAYPGVPSRFPTVFDPATGLPQGPMHINPREQAFLGYRVSLEQDADIGVDEDPTNNIIPQNNRPDQDYYDDGVTLPLILPDCGTTSFDYKVTVAPTATSQNFYVNVWFDWNRDGDWEDNETCSGSTAPEWAVQNQLLTLGPGMHVLSTPTFLSTHPAFTGTPAPIWMRIMITTLASDTDDGSGPANGYPFGETEDYYFVPRFSGEIEYDFGDAPDDPNSPAYPTLHANGGAYHLVLDGFLLGGQIDSEPDGQPTGDAMGDDNINIDDEDGVNFTTPLVQGQPASVDVVASADGILNVWIDYNANSSWMEPGEHVFIDVAVSAGNNSLSFTVPATAAPGITFARFRLSRIPGLLSTGYGHAGEIEDYEIGIEEGGEGPPLKWRQIPLENEDPDMPFTPYFFGWDVKSVYDGTYIADDWFCKAPRPVTEIYWWGSYTDWDSAFPPPIAPHAFHIGIWTDVPKGVDKDWSHPGELIRDWIVPREITHEHVVGNDFHPEYMSKPDTCFRYEFIIPPDQWFQQEGDSTIYWLSISALYEEVPDSFFWGWKTREHFFHDDAVYIYDPVNPTIGAAATMTEPIDEGWDLAFLLMTDEYFLEYDFGDAPFERYPTFFGQNGAHHIYDPRVFLGQHIDTEMDGKPDPTSTGDDNDGMNDDDGINFLSLTNDGVIQLEVTASCPGYLNAWMDFDNNGNWAEPDDQIFRDELLPGGTSNLTIQVPDGAVSPPFFSRFRFSTEPELHYVGIAIDGEVEDYLFDMKPTKIEQKEASILPTKFRLYQNYPNPFNTETIIQFDLPAKNIQLYHVNISIFNIKGQLIRTLMDEQRSAGSYQLHWDQLDETGNSVGTGIYLYRIQANEFKETKKMILMK